MEAIYENQKKKDPFKKNRVEFFSTLHDNGIQFRVVYMYMHINRKI